MKGKLKKIEDKWHVVCIEEGDWETYYQVNPYDTEKIDQFYKRAGDDLFDVEFDFKVEHFWETGVEEITKVATLIKWAVESPTVSDNFQIGPDGAYEHTDDLDSYHYHEILDRLTIIGEMIEKHLIDHPVLEKHSDLAELVANAQELIVDAYLKMGDIVTKNQTT